MDERNVPPRKRPGTSVSRSRKRNYVKKSRPKSAFLIRKERKFSIENDIDKYANRMNNARKKTVKGDFVFRSRVKRYKDPKPTELLCYWEGVNRADRYLKSKRSTVSFGKQQPRKAVKLTEFADFDPIYRPRHDFVRPRLGKGKHDFNSFCTREEQRRTQKTCIESGTNLDGVSLTSGQHNFYRIKNLGSRDKRPITLANFRKTTGRKPLLEISHESESDLGGFVPIESSSKSRRTLFYSTFDKQSKRNRGMKNRHANDLTYRPCYDLVDKKRVQNIVFSKQTARKSLGKKAVASRDAEDFYDVRPKYTKPRVPNIFFGAKKCVSREKEVASVSRNKKEQYDGFIDVGGAYKKFVMKRVGGDPFIRNQQGRDQYNASRNKRMQIPEFYIGKDNTYRMMKKKDFFNHRWLVNHHHRERVGKGNVAFDKQTSRYGISIENAERALLQGKKRATNRKIKLFKVVSQRTGGENVAPPVGTYDVKFPMDRRVTGHRF